MRETFEDRLAQAVESMLGAMPADVAAECAAIVALDPEGVMAGVRVHPAVDVVHLSWAGRHIGSVSTDWLLTGTVAS